MNDSILCNHCKYLKYQFWKNVTSEKWNSGGLNTFGHILSSLLGVIAIVFSNHAQKWRQICPKVFNPPEFHFSEVTFLQNWYFNSKFSGLKICIMASNKIPETPILSRNLKQFAYLALMSSYFCPLKWIRFFSNCSNSPFFAQQFPIFSVMLLFLL